MQTFDSLKDLIVKEQFIDSCPKDLAIHLHERAPETLAKIAKIADQYLEAHGKHLFSPASRKPIVTPERDEAKNMQINPPAPHCFKCNIQGQKAVKCPTLTKKCSCVTSKDTKLETVDQVDGDQEDKIKMITLCRVVK